MKGLTRAVDDNSVVLVSRLHAHTDVVVVDVEATEAVDFLVRSAVRVAHIHLLTQLVALLSLRRRTHCCNESVTSSL